MRSASIPPPGRSWCAALAGVVDDCASGEVGDVAGAVGEPGRLLTSHLRRGVDCPGDGHGYGPRRLHPGVGGAEVGQADRVVAPLGQQAGQELGGATRLDGSDAGGAPPEPGAAEVPARRSHQRASVEGDVQVDRTGTGSRKCRRRPLAGRVGRHPGAGEIDAHELDVLVVSGRHQRPVEQGGPAAPALAARTASGGSSGGINGPSPLPPVQAELALAVGAVGPAQHSVQVGVDIIAMAGATPAPLARPASSVQLGAAGSQGRCSPADAVIDSLEPGMGEDDPTPLSRQLTRSNQSASFMGQ